MYNSERRRSDLPDSPQETRDLVLARCSLQV